MAARTLPSFEYLHQRLMYNPETGDLIWRACDAMPRKWNTRYAGELAGKVVHQGRVGAHNRRRLVAIDRVFFKATRIIFKMQTGHDPVGEIDHRDGNSLNNRWSNLRDCTHAENCRNVVHNKKRTLRYKGIYVPSTGYGFVAHIQVNRKGIYLGRFRTQEEAHEAYCAAAKRYFGEFWHP